MKNLVRLVVLYGLVGIGFGSVWLCLSLYFYGVGSQTTQQIVTVVVISAVIGLVSMIFESDWFSFTTQLILHFCVVYALVNFLNALNGYEGAFFSLTSLAEFALAYLLIWAVVYLAFIHRVHAINDKLQQKKRKSS